MSLNQRQAPLNGDQQPNNSNEAAARRPSTAPNRQTANGGRGARISLPIGGRRHGPQPHIQLHVPPGARVQVRQGPPQQQQLPPPVQLPRLAPQVLPDAQQTVRQHENDDHLERFVCAVCCEYMDEPVGCDNTSCSNRFCKKCLRRVMNQPANTTTTALCPTCRNPIGHLVADNELKSDMNAAPRVPCRQESCPDSFKLTELKAHEAVCPHVRVACRYASFGCSWQGPRGELQGHENDCTLAQVSMLVEQHRQLKADSALRLAHLYASMREVTQRVEIQNQIIRQRNIKSVWNPFHLLTFLSTLLFTTPHFLWKKNLWSSMLDSPGKRATLHDVLAMMPTVLLTVKMVLSGYRNLIAKLLLDKSIPSTADETWGISVLPAFLAMSIATCFYVDGSSTWRTYVLPQLGGCQVRATLGAVTTGLILFYCVAMKFYGRGGYAFLLWLWIVVASTFFPAIIGAMILPSSQEQMAVGKATNPMLFALRCGLLFTFFDFFTVLETLSVAAILQAKTSILPAAIESGTIVLDIPTKYHTAFLACRFAVQASKSLVKGELETVTLVGVWSVLLVMSFFMRKAAYVASKIGINIAAEAKRQVAVDGVRCDYNGSGLVIAAMYIVTVGFVAVS